MSSIDQISTQLNTISTAASGNITLDSYSVPFSGSAADLAGAFAGNFVGTLSGSVTIEDASSETLQATTLSSIGSNTGGTVNFQNSPIIQGTIVQLKAALTESSSLVSGNNNNVLITNSSSTITATDITAIHNAIGSGTITNSNAVTLSGSGSEVKGAVEALDTIHGSTDANITGTDYTVTHLKAINDKVGGTITLADTSIALSGTAANLVDALAGTFASAHDGEVKVTGTYDVTQLKAINTGTDGALHLADRSIGLSGTAANTAAALAGSFTSNKTHTGVVTLSDTGTVTATDITSISTAKGSGNINITSAVTLSGSGSEVKGAADALNTIHGSTDANITGTDYTVTHLKAINDKVGGTITLADTSIALSGTAANLVDALAGTFASAHAGTVKVTGTYDVTQLKAINNGTAGTITLANRSIALTGSGSDLAAALAGNFASTHTGTITISGTVSASDLSTIDGNASGSRTYSISDSVGNINGLSNALLIGASNITATDDGGSTGSILDLDSYSSDSTLSSSGLNITGDGGVNQVELSAVLSAADKTTIDFVDDASADRLIFNLSDSSDWVTFNANGTVSSSKSSFTFNTINNFDFANEFDLLGVYYGSNNIKGPYKDISETSTAFSMKLRDGIVYEDNFNSDNGLYITAANAIDPTTVRANIGALVNAGGTGANSLGSSNLDFTYVLYGQSSADSTVTSAYLYGGTYESTNQGANNFDASKLKIVGLAEIVDVTDGSLVTGSITTSKGGLA